MSRGFGEGESTFNLYRVYGGPSDGLELMVPYGRPEYFPNIHRVLEDPDDPTSPEVARYEVMYKWNNDTERYEYVEGSRRKWDPNTRTWKSG